MTKDKSEISEITSTGEPLNETTLRLFEMCAKFTGIPNEDGLANIRASLGICVSEIRRLREENKIVRDNYNDVLRELVQENRDDIHMDAKRLIQLGKAVEAMPEGMQLARGYKNGSIKWCAGRYRDEDDFAVEDSPLEALQAAQSKGGV